jgi:hypothetical protein
VDDTSDVDGVTGTFVFDTSSALLSDPPALTDQ